MKRKQETKQKISDTKTGRDGRSTWCVYIHTNKINGKKYVGKTSKEPKDRWMKNGIGYKPDKRYHNNYGHFWYAIQKYGWDNFEHEVIQTGLTITESADLEKELIARYDTTNPDKGYNVTKGGEGSEGLTHSEETKKLLSELAKERVARTGVVNFKGQHHTEESKARQRAIKLGKYDGEKNPFYGKKHSESTREKIAEYRSQPINQYSLEGEFIQQFPSGTIAAEAVGATLTSLSYAALGKTRFSAGYLWRYASEEYPAGKNIDGKSIVGDMKFTGQKKPINQYSLDGKFIATYESATNAANAVGAQFSNVSAAANVHTKVTSGFFWRYLSEEFPSGKDIDTEELLIEIEKKSGKKRIAQYDKEGNLIKVFPSVSTAAKELGVSVQVIASAARGVTKSCKGYKWSYEV